MSDNYRIRDNDKSYYITTTTVGWVDVFTRLNHKKAIVDFNKLLKNLRVFMCVDVILSTDCKSAPAGSSCWEYPKVFGNWDISNHLKRY